MKKSSNKKNPEGNTISEEFEDNLFDFEEEPEEDL
jgi:hypothetical protein